jgi:lipopolysaccharide biosynthesis protein
MKNCILLHLYYQDLWPEFWSYLKHVKDENTDLYVTVNTIETEWYNDIKNNSTEVYVVEERGVDFGGFLYALDKIKNKEYLTVTKLHGKKSLRNTPHTYGEQWRRGLYLPLIGTKNKYEEICSLFEKDEKLFLCGGRKYYKTQDLSLPIRQKNHDNDNKMLIENLLSTHHIPLNKHISGSMMVLSKKYLDLLFKGKEMEVFEFLSENSIHKTGTPFNEFHLLEQIITAAVEPLGGTIKLV